MEKHSDSSIQYRSVCFNTSDRTSYYYDGNKWVKYKGDVVEVVRCKDCKWYDPTHPYGTVIPDAFHCKVNDKFYQSSHFCGYGERREDG